MSDGGAFSSGFANAYRMMMDREEKRKEQQASKAYFDMLAQDAQARIQPITDAATRANENSFSADVKRDASAMTDAAVANNPALTQKVAGTSAPVTPAQQSAWQANNNNNAQQADNQAAQTQQMLQQAQQKYGTEMFGRLGTLIEKGMDPRMAMKIADNHIAKAEAAALKEQMRTNVKVLSDKSATPEQKQAVLAQMMVDNPQAARGLAEAFGLKQDKGPATFAPGSYVRQSDGSYKQIGTPTALVNPKEPPVTYSGQTFKDEMGREYQLDSRGQRHYAPRPVSPKDTQLKDINDAESRELSYLRLQASQNKFPTPGQVKEMEKQARQIQMKYQGMREGMKQNKQPATGNIDLNNLTPEQLDQARQLKELGLTKEQIAEELRFRASGAKGR